MHPSLFQEVILLKAMDVVTDWEALTMMSKVNQLLSRGILRRRNGSYYKLSLYTNKKTMVVRCLIYAMIDMLNEGRTKFWKAIVEEYVKEHREKYMEMLKYRMKTDSTVEKPDELFEEIKDKPFYRPGDYDVAWAVILDSIAKYKVVVSESTGHHLYEIHFTKFGKELKRKVDDGYVF